jgi:hypothetical protein
VIGMAVETATAISPMLVPIAIVAVIIIVIIAWKVLKFAIKKISAVIQGIAGLALIGMLFYMTGQIEATIAIGFGIAGIGLIFGAISNILG